MDPADAHQAASTIAGIAAVASALGIPGAGLVGFGASVAAGSVAHGNTIAGLATALGMSPATVDNLGLGVSSANDIPGLTGDDLGLSSNETGVYGGAGGDQVGSGGFSGTGGVGGLSGNDPGGSAASGATGEAGPGGEGGGGSGSGGGSGGGQGGTGGGGMCCFTAGTLVTTPDGFKTIEDVETGDIVRSYDLDTHKFVDSPVGKTKIVTRTEFYKVTFQSGRALNMTDDHPLFTASGWASINPETTASNPNYDRLDRVQTLSVGTPVMTESEWFDTIVSIEHIPGKIKTYTLGGISPANTFFAEGYLASNWC
jgi:hypothetical protein